MRQKLVPIIVSLLVIIAPFLVSSLLLYAKLGVTLGEFVPFWNDELWHWHQAVTFAAVGWDGGYYTLNENIPLFDFSHYYSWGAWLYVYYGIIMRFVGTNLNTFMFINAVTFALATAILIRWIRPPLEKLILLGAVLATFVPLIQYIPSNMPFVLQLSIGLIIAGGFYQVLSGEVSTRFIVIMTIVLMLFGLSRPTFTVFLFPLYVLASKNRNWKTILRALVVSVPLTIISAIGFYLSAAPFPHFRTRIFLGAGTLGEKFQSVLEYMGLSIGWLLHDGDAPTFAMRLHVLLLIGLLLGWGIFLLWKVRQGERESGGAKPYLWEITFHLFNLVGFYVLTILFHEALGGHDYRVMAVHLFISLIVLATMQRRLIIGIMVVASVIALPTLWDLFEQKTPNFNGIGQGQYEYWQPILADSIAYDSDAENAWCNTVTMSAFYVTPFQGEAGLALAMPAGLGLSWAFDWDETGAYAVPENFKARYLMLHRSDFEAWQDRLDVREIIPVHEGTLYENLVSSCEAPQAED